MFNISIWIWHAEENGKTFSTKFAHAHAEFPKLGDLVYGIKFKGARLHNATNVVMRWLIILKR